MSRLADRSTTKLREDTWGLISRENARNVKSEASSTEGAAQRWKHAASLALNWSRSKEHYQDHLSVTAKEHMSGVDCFDGQKARSGEGFEGIPQGEEGGEDLPVVSPIVDGRLRDEGRN